MRCAGGGRVGEVALAAGALVLLWFTAASGLAGAAFAAGLPLPRESAWIALALSGAATLLLARRSGVRPASLAIAAGLVALLAAASAALALALLDLGDDSQTYHLSAVIRLAQGWIPWRERLGGSGMTYGWCLDRYPRASYVAGAAAYLASGRLDLAKAPALFLMGGALALALAAARALLPARPFLALLVAALAAANPVALVQLSTSYVDGPLASALLGLVAALALLARAPTPLAFACAVSVAALACGLKFTGVVYALALGAAGCALAWAYRGSRSGATVAAAALAGVAAALLALEANPYLANMREGGNPFYPVVGGGPGPWSRMAGGEEGEMTPAFASRSREAQLALSLFARADSLPGQPPGIRLKAPFTVYRRELRAFRGVDTRASGLGPLFSGAVVLSALLLALARARDRRAALLAGAAAAALVGSALLMPYPWWARYAPQLWFAPLAVLVAGASLPGRPARALSLALSLAMLADTALVGAVHFAGEVRGTRDHRAQLERLAELSRRAGPLPVAFGRSESHRVRLEEHGVRVVEGALPCAAPVQLLSLTDTRLCLPEPVATVVWP